MYLFTSSTPFHESELIPLLSANAQTPLALLLLLLHRRAAPYRKSSFFFLDPDSSMVVSSTNLLAQS
jgi:hypothetical protein